MEKQFGIDFTADLGEIKPPVSMFLHSVEKP